MPCGPPTAGRCRCPKASTPEKTRSRCRPAPMLRQGGDVLWKELKADLHLADPFPFQHPDSKRILHGSLDLATELLALPGISLGDTLRRRSGALHVQLSSSPVPVGCIEHPAVCPARIVRRFTTTISKR